MNKQKPKTKESQLNAQKKYDSKNTKAFALKLNYTTDRELIDKLESVENIQGYIKELIRKDLNG